MHPVAFPGRPSIAPLGPSGAGCRDRGREDQDLDARGDARSAMDA